MIRDDEIERLVKYAQALGVKVVFSNIKNPESTADWDLDGSQITIYTRKNPTKIETVLSLVHEISHQKGFIYRNNRQIDTKFEDALPDEEEEISKRRRKVILDIEKADTSYWLEVYKDTGLTFPLWKLYAAIEFDTWQYEVYYETGKFPTVKERNKKSKEINAKHRKVKYE